MQAKVNSICFVGAVMIALIVKTSTGAFASDTFESGFSPDSHSPELLSSQSIIQVAVGNIATALNQYIEENQDYFDNYTLRESNKIGSGNAIWEEAKLNFDQSSGDITLDLEGTALIPFPASLFYPNPEMQLKLSFTPNECLQYSYSGHALEVGGDLEAIIHREVSALLENSARDIEASLNNEVTQSLRNLQLLDDLGC